MRRKAFTYLELIMILTIMSVIGFIVMPRFVNLMGGWTLQTEAQRMAAKIRQAQQLSISQGKNYGIWFNMPSMRYHLGVNEGYFMNIEENELANGISFYSVNPDTVYFDSLGEPVDVSGAPITGGVQIYLRDSSGKQVHLDVYELTGKVRIF